MAAKFDDLLESLQDSSRPLPNERLPELSDLDAQPMQRLSAAWPRIADDRRRALVEALGRLADDRIEFTFERINRFAMDDPLPEIRAQAIRNLWECEDPALVGPLLHALAGDADTEVRAAASSALGAYLFLGETESLPAGMLPRIEEGLLAAAASDRADDVRRRALESLGYSSRREVPGLIEEAYASDEQPWRRSSLVAMGRSASKPWGPKVIHELTSPAPVLRLEAARAAGELDLQDAVPSLIDLLEDVDDDVRRAAIWSLGQLGGAAANEALLRLLDRAEDEDEIELLEDALGNLAFVDGTRDFLMFDFDDSEDGSS
jgi:HEAT repeat protein